MRELREKQAAAGTDAARDRVRAPANVVFADFAAGLDFSTPEGIARSCAAVAQRLAASMENNPAACGQAIAKLAGEARAALRDAQALGEREGSDTGVIREFRFEVARRAPEGE